MVALDRGRPHHVGRHAIGFSLIDIVNRPYLEFRLNQRPYTPGRRGGIHKAVLSQQSGNSLIAHRALETQHIIRRQAHGLIPRRLAVKPSLKVDRVAGTTAAG